MAARGSIRGVLASLVFGGAAAFACGGNSNYGTAAVGLGATVLATGVHRAVTGSCWGNCSKGFYCDHESGVCQRGECDPSCREGDYCVKEASGDFRCVAPAGTYAFGKPKSPAPRVGTDPDAGPLPAPLATATDASLESESVDAGANTDDAGANTASDVDAAAGSDAAVDGGPGTE